MTHDLTLCVDENIPCAEVAFGRFGEVQTLPGREMDAAAVRDADVLLVRSVTTVDRDLLEGSSVQFVGSATIGTDHVDQPYLNEAGIAFAHAPASNADSVADYVIASLLHLCVRYGRRISDCTVAIVGCGNIGGRLARRLPSLGASVRLNDPPRREMDDGPIAESDFEPLENVLEAANVVTLHTPLTTEGDHPTHHLFDAARLANLRSGTWLINSSRGAVVDNAALTRALDDGPVAAAVVDVWENEPTPSLDLLRRADLATPHVAGYALDGKVRGTRMLYTALCRHLGVEPAGDDAWNPSAALAPDHPDDLRCTPPDARLPRTDYLHALTRQAYDITADDDRLRGILDVPTSERGSFFSTLRKTYPVRRELQQFSIPGSAVPDAYREAVTEGLTVSATRDA